MIYLIAHSNHRIADHIVGAVADKGRQEGQDITFKMLREFFPEVHDPLKTPQITNKAGLDVIGDPDALIWAPAPTDIDWFRNICEQGYQKKMIMLNIGFSNACDLFPGATHYIELYQQREDTGEFDTSQAVDRLYDILKN